MARQEPCRHVFATEHSLKSYDYVLLRGLSCFAAVLWLLSSYVILTNYSCTTTS